MRVPADPEQWSDSSRKSVAYEFGRDEYADIHYLCWRCGVPAVYSAEDQRIDYEVLKAYISQRRYLCTDCWQQRRALEKRIEEHNARWKTDKRNLERDTKFLREWLEDLEALPGYGGRPNKAHIGRLRRLLEPSN
jgi:hypothetical protein